MEKEKHICPYCGEVLEKIEVNPEFAWLEPPGFESWGCPNCGNSFFKKIE